jgi:hypothetical protein
MKKFTTSIIITVILICLLGSCVSIQDRPITMQELAHSSYVGTVTTKFTTYRFLHFIGDNGIKNKAYSQLLDEARKQYGDNVVVRNIQIKGSFSALELLLYPGASIAGTLMDVAVGNFDYDYNSGYMINPVFGLTFGTLGLLGNAQKITATGEVILLSPFEPTELTTQSNLTGIEGALNKAATTLINALPMGATIAILNVYSNDQEMAAYVIDELEFALVLARRFTIVDRRRLEQVRTEQNFQLSGDVSDDSAISIGNMLGATIVITGDISSIGTSQRLVLRALDVKTAQIITMARESL